MEDKTENFIPASEDASLAFYLNQDPQKLSENNAKTILDDIYRKFDSHQWADALEDGSFGDMSEEKLENLEKEDYNRQLDYLFSWIEKIEPDHPAFENGIRLMVELHERLDAPYQELYEEEKWLERAWVNADRKEMSSSVIRWLCQALSNSEIRQSGREGDRSHIDPIFEKIQNPVNLEMLEEYSRKRFLDCWERRRTGSHGDIFQYEDDRVDLPVYCEMYLTITNRRRKPGYIDELFGLPIYGHRHEPDEDGKNAFVLNKVWKKVFMYGEKADLNNFVATAMKNDFSFIPVGSVVNFAGLNAGYDEGPFEFESSDFDWAVNRNEFWKNKDWISLTNQIKNYGKDEFVLRYPNLDETNVLYQQTDWVNPENPDLEALKAGFYGLANYLNPFKLPITDQNVDQNNERLQLIKKNGSVFVKMWQDQLYSVSEQSTEFEEAKKQLGMLFLMLMMGSTPDVESGLFGFYLANLNDHEEFNRILDYFMQKELTRSDLELLVKMVSLYTKENYEEDQEPKLEDSSALALVKRLDAEQLEMLYDIIRHLAVQMEPGEIWKPVYEIGSLAFRHEADAIAILLLASGLQVHPVNQVLDDFSSFTSFELRKEKEMNLVPEQIMVDEILDLIERPDLKMEAESYYEFQGVLPESFEKDAIRERMTVGEEHSEGFPWMDALMGNDEMNKLIQKMMSQSVYGGNNASTGSAYNGETGVLKNSGYGKKQASRQLEQMRQNSKKKKDKAKSKNKKANAKKSRKNNRKR